MIHLDALASLTDVADGQWGQVTTAQVTAAGISEAQLAELLAHNIVEPVIDGVIRLRGGGRHPLPRLFAGWLLLSPPTAAWERTTPASGVLSHRSALRLYRLGDSPKPQLQVIAAPGETLNEGSVSVVRAELAATDWRIIDDLPVTTPARTLSDLARNEYLDVTDLERAVRGFVAGGWATIDELADALERTHSGRWRELVATLSAEPAV